jgi:anti-sigma B factor antagonist
LPHREQFVCEVEEDAESAIVAAFGEVDLSTVGQIAAALGAEATIKSRVTLDLRGLTFMDASGVRAILAFQAQARRDGFAFAVVKAPPHVQRVLSFTGLSDQFTLVDTPPRFRA